MAFIPSTRILATLGPSSEDPGVIRALVEAGASAFRLNFSHGDHPSKAKVIAAVRAVGRECGRPLALVGDLSGPKLRTGPVDGGGTITLESGTDVTVSTTDESSTPGRIAVIFPGLMNVLEAGDRILLDDGHFELEVSSVGETEARCRVIYGGELSSFKGFNLPGSQVGIPSLTDKDREDVVFALEHDLDWLALSFVQTARDIVDLKRLIALAGRSTPVIAKIEKPRAVANLASILDVSDGIMVARGDLGVEMGPETLPMAQKRIILAARKRSKLVITATQMLDSMTHNPRPTRAEASDVANAIFDGTDVVMLSQETAMGDFPVRTVATMRAIAADVERSSLFRKQAERFQTPRGEGIAHAAIQAAAVAAEQVGARAIVAFSSSGWTALNVSSWRPKARIYAVTHLPQTGRRLSLCWGVDSILMEPSESFDDLYSQGIKALVNAKKIDIGDIIILLSGSVLSGHGANSIKIHRVSRDDF